ncbi:SCYL3 [Acanthosepion pharaonis]|uniref:SCYL3 n=1 Tax=Acanthosepion pharaonis TaxID=158019 RepID=A0A812DXZ5_ACAPH|nr:SCYL3 [Sepia pharaonis]
MGAENSVLEDCDIGKALPVVSDVDWILREAVRKNNMTTPSSSLAVFTLKKKDSRRECDIIQLNAKQLKSVRHPGILQYVTSGHSSDGSYLITEYVTPLEYTVKQLSPIEICSGLHGIIESLVFLHEKVRISHNNICKSSIFVTNDGSWKLGSFEHACHFENLTAKFLDNCRALRCEKTISPEEKAGNLCIEANFEHVFDAYAFGILAEEFLEQLQELGDLSKTFELHIQDEYLNPDPKQRSKLCSLLNNRLFKYENHFLEIRQFLRNITVKSAQEKQDFFSRVISMLLLLPEDLIGSRLISLLLSRFVVLDEDAVEMMLPSLLIPRPEKKEVISEKPASPTSIFSKSSFKKYVIPELTKIFQVRELHIRHLLLKYFSYYVELFDRNDIEEIIFPQLLLGLRDTNDSLVSASLYALGDLVPILGGETVIGGPQKAYFKEGKPKFQVTQLQEMGKKPNNLHSIMTKSVINDFTAPKRLNLKTEKKFIAEDKCSPPEDIKDSRISIKDQTVITNISPSKSQPYIVSEDAVHVKEEICQEIDDEQEVIVHEGDWPDWDNNSSVTKKKDEIDYFVDMQPVILPTPKNELLSLPVNNNPVTVDNISSNSIELSFAVSEDAAEVDTTGWDDDALGWDVLDTKIN